MTEYTIRPVALCEGPRDASQYTYGMNFGQSCKTVFYVWYLEGSKPRTLIDAGAKATMRPEARMTDLTSVQEGLGKFGMRPDDIEIVIVTHLHWDHIALGHLYKNARFIVQKRELDYARNPHPIFAHGYDKSSFDGLNLETVDGESEIIPGVSVFLSPGHTPGGQSVQVNTVAGKAIITGFCCHLRTFEQTEALKQRGWEVTIPLLHHDVQEAYGSVLAVKRRADIIIAVHDAAFAGRERIP